MIASTNCGLEGVKGVTSVPTGDLEALSDAVDRLGRMSPHADQLQQGSGRR